MENIIKYYRCPICTKRLPESRFYVFKNGCVDNICKDCRCKDRSDDKPWTFFPLMMLYDIPYIETQWLQLMKNHIKKVIAYKSSYGTIFGKYFSKMKTASFKNCSFYDSAKLNAYDFQKNWHDREIFIGDSDILWYLELLTKEIKNKEER